MKNQLDKDMATLKVVVLDVKNLQVNAETLAKKTEIDRVYKDLKGYAPKHMIQDLQADIKDVAKTSDIEDVKFEMDKFRKHAQTFIDKDECLSRINTLNRVVHEKIAEKLDTEIMESYQEEMVKKLKKIQADAEDAYEKLDKEKELG